MAGHVHDKSIVLCLDFDGTLTSQEGSKTVFCDFYRSLQKNAHLDYSIASFKENLQDIFRAHFGVYDPDSTVHNSLISKSALSFLQQALSHQEIQINIISRNRKEYIEAVMCYQGLSAEQIATIEIYALQDKQDVVSRMHLENTKVLICDDNQNDLAAMKRGAIIASASEIFVHTAAPGNFNWEGITQEMLTWIPNPPVLHREPEPASPIPSPELPNHSAKPNFFAPAPVMIPGLISLGLGIAAVVTGVLSIQFAPAILAVLAILAATISINLAWEQYSDKKISP